MFPLYVDCRSKIHKKSVLIMTSFRGIFQANFLINKHYNLQHVNYYFDYLPM